MCNGFMKMDLFFKDTLFSIPLEIWEHILKNVNYNDILNFSRVSKEANLIAKSIKPVNLKLFILKRNINDIYINWIKSSWPYINATFIFCEFNSIQSLQKLNYFPRNIILFGNNTNNIIEKISPVHTKKITFVNTDNESIPKKLINLDSLNIKSCVYIKDMRKLNGFRVKQLKLIDLKNIK